MGIREVRFNSSRLRPSKEHHAVERLSAGTTTRKIILSGTKSGLNESVCGQIGEIRIAGISGWTKEPPADNYFVSPYFPKYTWKHGSGGGSVRFRIKGRG